jgi:hypothetical protein
MPLNIDRSYGNTLVGVRVFVYDDGGKTWNHHDDYKATEKEITFAAPADGLYWFAVQSVRKDGTHEPADEKRLKAAMKVYVNTEGKPLGLQKSYEDIQADIDEKIKQIQRRIETLESARNQKKDG